MNHTSKSFSEVALSLVRVINNSVEHCVLDIEKAIESILLTLSSGGKLLACGNGGSAADAQHFCAELVCTMTDKTRKPISALALTTDTSILTAYANDFDFEGIFARQIEALATPSDLVLLITTSGSSKNCLRAAVTAQSRGARTVALTRKGAEISNLVDCSIEVPSKDTQEIQEVHQLIYHYIALRLETALSKQAR